MKKLLTSALVLVFVLGGFPATPTAHATVTVSVKDYGAKGDGVTNDGPAFQQAINGLPAAGGTVFVPPGNFLVTTEIKINRDNVAIEGVGNESKISIKPGPYNTVFMVPSLENFNSQVVRNIRFARLEFDGNRVPSEWDTGPHKSQAFFAIWIGQAENIVLSELYMHDWAFEPITFSNGNKSNRNGTLEKIHIKGSGRNGFHFGQGYNLTARLVHVEDSPSQQWGPAAGNSIDMEVEGVEPIVDNARISDSLLEMDNTQTATGGVALQPAYGPLKNVVIERTFIRNFAGGVGALGTRDNGVARLNGVTIQDNWILDDNIKAFRNMFSVHHLDNFVAKNNVFNEYEHNAQAAISIRDAHNVTIDQNKIFRTDCPFQLRAANKQVTLSNNVYTANDCSIDDDNTSTEVTTHNNTVVQNAAIDRTPPSGVVIGANAGQVFSGPTQISVSAQDSGVGVARIMYFVDGIPQGVIDAASGAFTFDASRYQNGTHTISARAWDKNANVAPMHTVTITVTGSPIITTPPPPVNPNPPITPPPPNMCDAPVPNPTSGICPPPVSPPPPTSASLRLVNHNSTFYLIKNGQRHGITSPGLLWSYGFDFSDAKVASSTDSILPLGDLLLPGDGALVKSTIDPTVWLITDGQKRGFVSQNIFTGLGFKFSSVLTVTAPELNKLPQGSLLNSTSAPHPNGVDISDGNAIYWVSGGKKYPYPNMDVYNSWHRDNDFSLVVPANNADKALPVGSAVTRRVLD